MSVCFSLYNSYSKKLSIEIVKTNACKQYVMK